MAATVANGQCRVTVEGGLDMADATRVDLPIRQQPVLQMRRPAIMCDGRGGYYFYCPRNGWLTFPAANWRSFEAAIRVARVCADLHYPQETR